MRVLGGGKGPAGLLSSPLDEMKNRDCDATGTRVICLVKTSHSSGKLAGSRQTTQLQLAHPRQ